MFKLRYYQSYWSDSNQILYSDKDHHVLIVSRPKFASQIQDGGRQPS